MKSIKLIALDMDGTLLNRDLEVSRANREAIHLAQQRGVHVVLSTGRFIASTREYARSLRLTSYLVTSNGAEVWDASGKLWHRRGLPPELVEWMYRMGQKYRTRVWGATAERVWDGGAIPGSVHDHKWLKFGFDTEKDDVRNTIWEKLVETGELEVSNSTPTNIEVNARGVNKAAALETVCRQLNFSMDDVLAVGDSLNDVAMIRSAGIGVAMGNAQERVREAADWVTGTNEEDGVAKAIHRWVLGTR